MQNLADAQEFTVVVILVFLLDNQTCPDKAMSKFSVQNAKTSILLNQGFRTVSFLFFFKIFGLFWRNYQNLKDFFIIFIEMKITSKSWSEHLSWNRKIISLLFGLWVVSYLLFFWKKISKFKDWSFKIKIFFKQKDHFLIIFCIFGGNIKIYNRLML